MAARKRTGAAALSDWDHLRIVLAVRRGGTLSGAGRILNVDHTTVARRLSALERDLGGAVFERGPEGLAVTPLGEEVVAAAERMQVEIDGLLRRLDGAVNGPTGSVRLTATPFLVGALFAPAVASFLRGYPGLQIELIGDNRSYDLSRQEADLAVRMAHPGTPGLVAKRLGEMAFACYAGARDRRPFEAQVFIAYGDESGNSPLQRYVLDLVAPEKVVLRSNTMQALITAVRDGAGCGLLPCIAAEGDPELRRVSVPHHMAPVPMWLVYHEDLRRSPRLRVAISFVDSVMAVHRKGLVPTDFPFE